MNIKVFFITLILGLTMIPPLLYADEYVIEEYEFIWHVVTVDNVNIKIQKTPKRLGVLLSGRGGKIGTLFLTASRARAIGEALLKAEDYYRKHLSIYEKQPKGFERDQVDTVPAGGHKVIYASTAKVKELEVRVMQPKLISPIVVMTKDEALRTGKYLLDAGKMVEMVDLRVQP